MPDDGKDMEFFQQWVERRKAWYAQYGIDSERLRSTSLRKPSAHITRAPAPRARSFSMGLGRARIDRPPRDVRPRTRISALRQRPALLRRSGKDALYAALDRELGGDRPYCSDFLIDAYERERSVDPNGKETNERCCGSIPPCPCKAAVFSLARNKPDLVDALARSNRRCARRFGRSTTKVTSASSTGAKTRSAPILRHRRLRALGDGNGHGAHARFDAARNASRGSASLYFEERLRP